MLTAEMLGIFTSILHLNSKAEKYVQMKRELSSIIKILSLEWGAKWPQNVNESNEGKSGRAVGKVPILTITAVQITLLISKELLYFARLSRRQLPKSNL